MPEPPAPMKDDATRPRPVRSGLAFIPPRSPPIASISSMNPIAPPSFRASLRRRRKNERIFAFVIPNHIDWNAGAALNRNGTPACLAIALARYVLPVPGGPSNSIPRRGLPPSWSRNVAYPRNTSSVRPTSSTWLSSPRTSSSPTSISSGRTIWCGDRPLNSGIAIISTIMIMISATGAKMIASGPSVGILNGLSVR